MGTILPYNGSISNIPEKWALCNGSNGTPNLTGRFLEGVTSSPGSLKSAGLPNITGSMGFRKDGKYTIADGAFQGVKKDEASNTSVAPGNNQPYKAVSFDASRCSSIYKDDCTTVQPASYTVLYIMKIKA